MVMAQQATEADSAGNALNRYSTYAQSTEAKVNDLKNATEQMWLKLINSNTINLVIGGLTSIVKFLDEASTASRGFGIALIALSISAVEIIRNFTKVNSLLSTFGTSIGVLFINIVEGMKASLAALLTPAGAIIAIIGVATYAIIQHIQHQRDLQQETEDLTKSYQNLTTAIKDNNDESMKNETNNIKKTQDELQQLINRRRELEEQLKNTSPDEVIQDPTALTTDFVSKQSELQSVLDNTNKSIAEQEKVLKDAGVAFDDTTGEIYKLSDAQQLIKVNDTVKQIKDEAQAHKDNDQTMLDLINRYQQLNDIENKSAAQQKELSNVAQELNNRNKDFTISIDKNGNAVITNTKLLGSQKDALELDIQATNASTQAKVNNAINSMKFEYNNTQYTISQVEERIKAYQAEVEALQQTEMAKQGMLDMTYVPTNIQRMYEWYGGISDAIGKIKNEASGLSASAPTISGGSNSSSDNYFPEGGSGSGSSKSVPTSDIEPLDMYKNAMDGVTESITNQEKSLANLQKVADTYSKSKDYQTALAKENDLLVAQTQHTEDLKKSLTLATSIKNDILSDFKTKYGLTVNGNTTQAMLEQSYNNYFGGTRTFASEEAKKTFEDSANGLKTLIDDWKSVGDQIDNINSKIDDSNTKIQDINNTIQSQLLDAVKRFIDAQKQADDEIHKRKINNLNAQMKAYDDQLKALQTQNQTLQDQDELQKDILALQQAQTDLANAQAEHNVRLYTGKGADNGWEWVADPKAVQSAQDKVTTAQETLDKKKQDIALKNQEDLINAEKEATQNAIDAENAMYDNQYKNLDAMAQNYLDALKNTYGDKWDNILTLLQGKLGKAQSIYDQIMKLTNGQIPTGITGSYSNNFVSASASSSVPIVKVNTATDAAILKAQYGSSINVVQSQGSGYVGADRNDTNAYYQAQLSNMGIKGKNIGDLYKGFAQGGTVDYTGMAMVHGTSTKPEFMLSNSMLQNVSDFVSNPMKYFGNVNLNIPKYDFSKNNNADSGVHNHYDFHDFTIESPDVDGFISFAKTEVALA